MQNSGKKALYQQTALADIELEKFLFMKVSEILVVQLNLKGQDIAVSMICAEILENIGISNLEQDQEFSEINCLIRDFEHQIHNLKSPTSLNNWKVLKSLVDRGERFANKFTEEIINCFQENVLRLGQALSIDINSLTVFSESFVRFHLVFQLSKCLDYLNQSIR